MRFSLIVYTCATLLSSAFAQNSFDTSTYQEEAFYTKMSCKKIDTTRLLALEDVIMMALCNNPQTAIAWQNSLYQASLVKVSESSYFPTLNATASLSQSETTDTKTANQENIALTISYLLYDFGKREATVENAKQLLSAASFTQDSTVQTVFLSALQAYYGLFNALASLEATKEIEAASLESLNAAKTRYNTGVATPSDTLQAQTAYSQAVLNRIRAEGSVKSAQGTLSTTLGLSPDKVLSLVTPPMEPSMEFFEKNIQELIDVGKKTRPDLMAAQAKIKALEASVQAAKAEDMPSLSISSTLGHTDSSLVNHNRNSSVGLYVNVPLFNGYNTKYKVQAAKEQLRIAQSEYEKLSQNASLEVYQTYQALVSEVQALKASLDLVTSAKASYELSQGKYKAGVGTILDLLNAQSALATAKQQRVQSIYNWYTTKASLAKSMGELNFTTLKGQP